VELCCSGLRPGVGRTYRDIFIGNVSILGYEADQESRHCRGC
jgi:hypothetical protein